MALLPWIAAVFARHNPSSEQQPSRFAHFMGELKRRQVFKVTSVYLVAAWGLSAGGAEILPALGLPDWTVRYLVITLFAATPLVALLAWLFEISNRGIERDFGPTKVTEQETVLATDASVPLLTTCWHNQQRQFAHSFDVGRDEACALQLVDPMISRRHARIELRGEQWWLRDLGSANGTVVNGAKVDSTPLESGANVVFYPGGPALEIDISRPESETATVLAAASANSPSSH